MNQSTTTGPDVYIWMKWNCNIVLWCFVSLAMYSIMEIYQNNIIATRIYYCTWNHRTLGAYQMISSAFYISVLNGFTDHWMYCFTSMLCINHCSVVYVIINNASYFIKNILSHPICLQGDDCETDQIEQPAVCIKAGQELKVVRLLLYQWLKLVVLTGPYHVKQGMSGKTPWPFEVIHGHRVKVKRLLRLKLFWKGFDPSNSRKNCEHCVLCRSKVCVQTDRCTDLEHYIPGVLTCEGIKSYFSKTFY